MKKNIKINEILEKLKIIETKLEKKFEKQTEKKLESVDDFIPEREAKKLLTRGTTWFWEQRKNGLPFSKLGAEVYYKKSDLLKLLK